MKPLKNKIKTTKPRILIIGGYGVFGGYLAERLLETPRKYDVIIAGRTLSKATTFANRFSGAAFKIDRNSSIEVLEKSLLPLKLDIIVDASGPFDFTTTNNGYSVAKTAIKLGIHYIDLADDADFVANISALNSEALKSGVSIISGASSVPALSSAVVDALSSDLKSIETIEYAILPGNKAPRGRAVVDSILGQAGKPFKRWQDGDWKSATCWGDLTSIPLNIPDRKSVKAKWASELKIPDTLLFPNHYQANNIIFRAGLELKIMQGGLWLLRKLVRWKILKSLRPFSGPIFQAAKLLEPFGTDRGGMVVNVTGANNLGVNQTNCWTLIAEAGDGPRIPPTPTYILIEKLLAGKMKAGAYPALSLFTLEEAETALSRYKIFTHIEENLEQ